jgi:hypothetical protein
MKTFGDVVGKLTNGMDCIVYTGDEDVLAKLLILSDRIVIAWGRKRVEKFLSQEIFVDKNGEIDLKDEDMTIIPVRSVLARD